MAGPTTPVRHFRSATDFRRWLQKNHDTAAVLQVGYYNKPSGKNSITYPESVDEALCFGWIDGVRHKVDADSYAVRFTPRRRGSIWSTINIKRIAELRELGLVHGAGLSAFEGRDLRKAGLYSTENRHVTLSAEYERRFRRNNAAWSFFESQPAGYRRVASFWVMDAKREETRERRLGTLIEDSAAGRRIGMLTRASDRRG